MNVAAINFRALWWLAPPLPAISWLAVGFQGGVVPTFSQWVMALTFGLVTILLVLLYHLSVTVRDMPAFIDPRSGHLNLAAMWRGRPVVAHAVVCAGLMLWVNATMMGIPLLADLHRQWAIHWNDAALWRIEQPVFDWIRGLGLGRWAVRAFDLVYGLMWVFVIGVLVYCVARREFDRALEMTITVGLLFYARLVIAIAWPTAGPALHQPEHFEFLAGSTAADLQRILLNYHQGIVAQNGLIPGLVAMPSLHIGFTWLACRHLVALVPSAKWPSAGWLLLTWVATVVLGWHYIADGFGGIAAAMACAWVAHRIAPRLLRPA